MQQHSHMTIHEVWVNEPKCNGNEDHWREFGAYIDELSALAVIESLLGRPYKPAVDGNRYDIRTKVVRGSRPAPPSLKQLSLGDVAEDILFVAIDHEKGTRRLGVFASPSFYSERDDTLVSYFDTNGLFHTIEACCLGLTPDHTGEYGHVTTYGIT